MATQFETPEAAQAKYDEIAKTLLTGDPSGTKFGHNQVRLNDAGQFETFDLRFKNGDPNALVQQGNSVVDALNTAVSTYGLDTSNIKKGVGLGSVRYDPSVGIVRDANTLFNDIFNSNFKDQLAAKMASYAPKPAEPAPVVAPPPAPPPPLQYGQPPAPPPPPAPAPVDPATLPPNPFPQAPPALGSLAPPPAAVPTFGNNPAATPDGAPGFQSPLTALNNVPRGPVIGGQFAQATAKNDPYMQHRAPQYRTPLMGDQGYEQMGLRLLSRYGMSGPEHDFLPNRSTFLSETAPKRYGEGSVLPSATATTPEQDASAVYNSMRVR
jgi:hypothetical protein